MYKNVTGCYYKYCVSMCCTHALVYVCSHVGAHMWSVCVSLYMQVGLKIDVGRLPQSFFYPL